MQLIKIISNYLELSCQFFTSAELHPVGDGDDRLLSIANILDAEIYISGEGGEKYQDPGKFKQAGVDLIVKKYNPIPYTQIHGDFIPGLSVLDALFNLGKETRKILSYVEEN